ncbi:MAG TPA: hypothetical protein VK469_23240 [Candidatus Kapabacteria bacterium]|nr:hypothetical protein [Candidatus Kapabacteria bacterium]
MKFVIIIFSFFSMAPFAYANAGVPMIFITLPDMVIGLIPIIFIESYVLFKNLKKTFKICFKTSAIANTVSTLLGIPVTWLLLVVLQQLTGGGRAYGMDTPSKKLLSVTWQAPWLIPYEKELYWMIPSATLVLLIPFFFASWFIEYQLSKRKLPDVENAVIKKSFFLANLVSYILLALVVLIKL